MSIEKGDISEVDGSAPLDLRVKKEVKAVPTTPVPENVPLNLSKPVLPNPAPPAPPAQPPPAPPQKVLKREREGGEVRSKPGGPGLRAPVPPPLVKHTTAAGNVSKTMLVRPPSKPGGPVHRQMGVVPPPDAMVSGHGGASSFKRPTPSHVPHAYMVPQHLTAHTIALDTVVGSPKMAVGTTESNHTSVTIGATSPVKHSGPTKSAQTSHGAPPSLSPSKGPRIIVASPANAPSPTSFTEHYVKTPSPRSHHKKKTSSVPRESPVHVVPVHVMSDSSPTKVSPSPSGRQDKQGHMPHGIQQGIPTSMDRLVAHGAPPRSLSSAGTYPGNSQKHPSGHLSPSGPLPQEMPSHPRPRLPHRKKSPTSPPTSSQGVVSQGQEFTAAPRHRPGLPQQLPRQAPPQQLSPQQVPQRLPVATAPHGVHALPAEALLRLRHPITAASSQPEGLSLYPPRATRPPATLPGPHGPPPALSQAPHHPTQPRPSPPRPSPPRPAAPHTSTQVSAHSPTSSASSPSSSSSSSTSQPHPSAPPFREVHHQERIRHPGPAGQGYIPPPPNSEYYPMRPRGPQTSSTTAPAHPPGVPPQTSGPMQAPGQRFPSTSAPYPVNPFVSLSIAIDCQRATEQDSDGDTALHIAIVQDKPDMGLIRRLIELVRLAGKSVDIFNFMQQTPLHLACIMKDSDVIRLLVEASSNPNEADRNGQTAAHHTCKSGTPSCLGAILRYSQVEVNLNIRNYEGYTPLHLAAMVGNPTLVTMLLEKGADLNSKDSKNGWTPLFHAVTNQDTKLVHKMLSSGAEVNVQSYSGNTVLHVATGRGYTDIVKILVHYGADMSLKNTQWDTPATITTDKNMSSLLRGLGAGSPQPNDTSSPSTAPPTLPMPLNDAYLIRPPPSASALAAAAAAAAAASTQSKLPSTVTTMTTERLKGPANEVYTVTRSVTRPDAKSPDGQRAIHKQTQEKLRHSIQYRKVVNERRGESHQRKLAEDISPEQHAGNEKMVVVPVPAGGEEKDDRISGGHPATKAVSDSQGIMVALPSEMDKRSVKIGEDEKYHYAVIPRTKEVTQQSVGSAKAKSTPDVVPKIEITSPEPASKTEAQSKSEGNQKPVHKPTEKDAKVVMSYSPSDSCTHKLVINVNGHLRTVPLKADNPKVIDKKIPQIGVPIAPKVKTPPRKIDEKEPTSSLSFSEHSKMEAALISSALIAPDIAAVATKTSSTEIPSRSPMPVMTATSESENELRARMLSLQYKNSDAILGNRYERKLDSVGSEQEHEVANTILTIRSRLQQQELERQQKQAQTCDADSTVKTEPISPTPVLSSTTSDSTPPAQSPLSPPVLEREGDRPLTKHDGGNDDDDVEPNLIIDESLKSKSRKRTRTPTKSIPNLSPAKSTSTTSSPSLSTSSSMSSTSDYVGTSSDSVKLGKVKVTGDPKKILTKKQMAMMGSQEPKRKRKKSEKSSKEN